MPRKVTRSEEYWETAPEHILRCTAHYKSNGQRCRREAAPGTTVCNQHGALIPAVQAKAAARIQMSVDDAVKRLQDMVDDPQVDARDKIKILHDLLDRGGLGATSKVLVGVGAGDPLETLFQSILSDPRGLEPQREYVPLPTRAEIEAYENTFLQPEDVVEAELVEDEPSTPENSHTVPIEGSWSANPPRHIAEALRELI